MATASCVGIFRRGTSESETAQSQSMASRTSPPGPGCGGSELVVEGGLDARSSAAQAVSGGGVMEMAAAGEGAVIVGEVGEDEVKWVRESSSSSTAKRYV